jgi:cobalt/nickel transport system permease protein
MLLAMHIPDGFLDLRVALFIAVVAAAGLAFALRQVRLAVGDRLVPLMGVMAAGIFAGQMVNFPLLGVPASGHLMGGVLAAAVLGPWGGLVAIAAVLVVQCFVFGDGGVTALGANTLNMACIGSTGGYVLYAALRRLIGGKAGTVIAAMLASWLIVPLAALAFAVEMSLSGTAPFTRLATLMLGYHILIGLGEALLTGLVVAWVVRVRPDLIYNSADLPARPERFGKVVAVGLSLGLAVAIFLAPFASDLDDGLEAAADKLGFKDRAVEVAFAPLPDYQLPAAGRAEAEMPVWFGTAAVVTSLLGCVGTLVTWGVALAVAKSVRIGAT